MVVVEVVVVVMVDNQDADDIQMQHSWLLRHHSGAKCVQASRVE